MRRSVLALLLLGLAACQAAPEEILAEARRAAERKDLNAFQGFFSERSAALLKGLAHEDAESRGDFRYLPDKDLFGLLPDGDVQEAEIRGRLALLHVGRNEKRTEEVVLLREPAGWRIDLYESERFWAPLTKKED